MESEDNLQDISCNELMFTSSDDEEVSSPVRKKFKSNCTESSVHSAPSTPETLLLENASEETIEASENVAENGVEQNHPVITMNANTDNILTYNISMNESTITDTDTPQSTVQPDTRYEFQIYRPDTSERTKRNMSDSVKESNKKHKVANAVKDKPEMIQKVRQNFLRTVDHALDADDLLPEDELRTLSSSTPNNIDSSMYKFEEIYSRGAYFKDLLAKACNEIHHNRQANASHNEHETPQPKPEPTPNDDCIVDPLYIPESGQQVPLTEFQFSVDDLNQSDNMYIIPEPLPGLNNQVAVDNNYFLLQPVQEELTEVNVNNFLHLTAMPYDLSDTYGNMVRQAIEIQTPNDPMFGMNVPTSVQLDESNLENLDTNPCQLNPDPELVTLLGNVPFDENGIACLNVGIPNEDMITGVPEDDNLIALQNHPVETECVLNPAQLEPNQVKLDPAQVKLEPNQVKLEANFDELETKPVELDPSTAPIVGDENTNSNTDNDCRQFVVVPPPGMCNTPVIVYIVNTRNPEATSDDTDNTPSQGTTSDDSDTSLVNRQEEQADVVEEEDNRVEQHMHNFREELNIIEQEITTIQGQANHFEEQAARFEERGELFVAAANFFHHAAEIFETAAESLQDAVDDFEAASEQNVNHFEEDNVDSPEIDNEYVAEEMHVPEENNIPDQDVPDVVRDSLRALFPRTD